MVINSQRTVYGLSLQMAQLLGLEYVVRPNTTLNEKFNIAASETLQQGVYPKAKYYAIGVGGLGYVNDIDKYNFSKHRPTDAALFEHIPFVIRTLDSDLTEIEQTKYRFRKIILINGVEYAAYYLKVIEEQYTVDDIYVVDVANSVSKLSKFNSNDPTLLNPTPRDPSNDLTSDTTARYVTAASKLKFSMSKTDIVEIDKVLTLLYGDNTKVITELAVCSGVDNTSQVPEATNVQILYHFEIEILTQVEIAGDKEIQRSLEIGGTEPLIL